MAGAKVSSAANGPACARGVPANVSGESVSHFRLRSNLGCQTDRRTGAVPPSPLRSGIRKNFSERRGILLARERVARAAKAKPPARRPYDGSEAAIRSGSLRSGWGLPLVDPSHPLSARVDARILTNSATIFGCLLPFATGRFPPAHSSPSVGEPSVSLLLP